MSVPVDYFSLYNSLPAKDRKLVLHTLMHWGGWTKTSVYRKLQCLTLSPLEALLLSSVFASLTRPRKSKQLEIDFDWDNADGFNLYLKKGK